VTPAPILIRGLTTPEDMHAVEGLQRRVWPGDETEIVPAHMLMAVAHAGGVLLGAYEGETLVGMVYGFLGTDSDSPDRVAMARLKHCSHMLAVDPDRRDRSIGYGLKLAQRQAVIRQGIRLITWTFDPLMSRNAHLNIRRLGAVCRTYLREVYGDMRDGLNVGLASDRFQVDWWITSNRVTSRLDSQRPPLELAHFLEAGVQKLNPAGLGPDDLPRPSDSVETLTGALALVEIPPDFPVLKARDLGLARAWRDHTRAIFEGAFAAGYLVTDFVHLRGERAPRSYYLLSQGDSKLG
jgi:predicted GNAT superfamily acetyltransferase